MRITPWCLAALVPIGLIACQDGPSPMDGRDPPLVGAMEASDDDDEGQDGDDASEDADEEVSAALRDVPAHVVSAALAAMPGIELVEAEIDRDGVDHYDLTGVLDGVLYEIEVTLDGEVRAIESEGTGRRVGR